MLKFISKRKLYQILFTFCRCRDYVRLLILSVIQTIYDNLSKFYISFLEYSII